MMMTDHHTIGVMPVSKCPRDQNPHGHGFRVVSALKSEGWDFAKFGKVKKNTLYVYFLTRQGVARPNVDSIHIGYQLRFIV